MNKVEMGTHEGRKEVWKVFLTTAKEYHKYLSSTNFALNITNKTALPFNYICTFSTLIDLLHFIFQTGLQNFIVQEMTHTCFSMTFS